MTYDPRVAIPTLVGSVLSCLATSCVLISYTIYGDRKRSFRHALVLNLAFAEFANSLNNSISGIISVTHGGVLIPGSACTLNGWIGQLSVQAADFSILAIAMVTLLTVRQKTYMPYASFDKKVLICLSVWLMPLVTSTIAVSLHEMTPVSGNWCWISEERTTLRYVLGHGWRFAIIVTTIGIYIYVYVYMRRPLSQRGQVSCSYNYGAGISGVGRHMHHTDGFDMVVQCEMSVHDKSASSPTPETSQTSKIKPRLFSIKGVTSSSKKDSYPADLASHILPPELHIERRESQNIEREIKRMLLLNAYPIMFVVLWVPGILNRVMEATGRSYEWLAILQSSTQYVGLANALTYGFNEHFRTTVAGWSNRV